MSKVQILTFCFTFIIQLFEYEAFPTYSSLADELGKESNSCNCGISKFGAMSCGSREGRIIGGRVVKENEIPWQVNIEMCFFDICERLCGGSVIGRKYILTAAHCILHNTHHLQVSLGLLNDSNPISDERVYSIESTKLHNDWNAVGAQNDIALLKLDRDIEFDTAVRPICLPSNPDNLFAKKPAVVSGWGTTSEENYESSPVMKRTILHVLENGDDKCRNNDPYRRPLSNKYICAFGTDTDACHIDSGGPLTLVENNTCSLAGIVSFGNGCAKKDFAGVYTRVSAHLDWIRENTLDDECLNRRHT
ncbi:trypsin-1 [Lepeophtheirus salmonis]|uniref:trypsin-1 n=1 Tax=Lepeophtheirus salmonis TaxID=72036 RepID=UPI001AEB8537|nr:trypsin-1-like [Lepeophtheirus salmonis]